MSTAVDQWRRRRRTVALIALNGLTILVGTGAVAGCIRADRQGEDGVQMAQRVTTRRVPWDLAFDDFETHWQRFVSPSPDLARPVQSAVPGESYAWNPDAVPECVYSETAHGVVPLVTLTWDGQPPVPAAPVARARLDLAVHHRGFDRAYYSSALLDDRPARLLLPATSALAADADAMLMTGPVIFPALIAPGQAARDARRQQVGLRDLGEGLSYLVRLSRWHMGAWVENGRAVVLVPVCSGGQ